MLWRLEHVLRGMQTPASRVVQVDFNRDPREVALALASNPLYAARILKTVNSAAFGLSRRIDSLPRAITYLGYNQVKNIVFQSMARDNLGAAESAAGFDPQAFWRHSHCVSVAAEHILRELDIPSAAVGAVTTAALLHDIGWVVFEKFDPRAAAGLFLRLGRAGEGTDTLALERAAFGFDHPLAGSLLAEQWNIPEAVCRLIGLHHADCCGLPEGLDRGSAVGAAVIALAERLAVLYGQPHPLAEPGPERVDLAAVLGQRARSIGVSARLRSELERTFKFIEEFSRFA
ncbi:HDOD domain-containing protein [bacterium]|nr:HDOD domain-containing protein [bacterium]